MKNKCFCPWEIRLIYIALSLLNYSHAFNLQTTSIISNNRCRRSSKKKEMLSFITEPVWVQLHSESEPESEPSSHPQLYLYPHSEQNLNSSSIPPSISNPRITNATNRTQAPWNDHMWSFSRRD